MLESIELISFEWLVVLRLIYILAPQHNTCNMRGGIKVSYGWLYLVSLYLPQAQHITTPSKIRNGNNCPRHSHDNTTFHSCGTTATSTPSLQPNNLSVHTLSPTTSEFLHLWLWISHKILYHNHGNLHHGNRDERRERRYEIEKEVRETSLLLKALVKSWINAKL